MRLLPMEATARMVAGIQVAVDTRMAADTQEVAGVRTAARFMEAAVPMAARFTGAARTQRVLMAAACSAAGAPTLAADRPVTAGWGIAAETLAAVLVECVVLVE